MSEIKPEIEMRLPSPISGTFGTIGYCRTFGTTGGTLFAGAGIGVATFLLLIFFNVDWKTALLAALASGGTTAIATYFTCKGVEAGVPIAVRK